MSDMINVEKEGRKVMSLGLGLQSLLLAWIDEETVNERNAAWTPDSKSGVQDSNHTLPPNLYGLIMLMVLSGLQFIIV